MTVVAKSFCDASNGLARALASVDLAKVRAALVAMETALAAGRKILVFGNGGSASQAQHFAAELVNGIAGHHYPPSPCVALTADSACVTAIGNDRGFETVFARQVEAVGEEGDVAVGISTSGNSPDVVVGLLKARSLGMLTVALTGPGGGEAAVHADVVVSVGGIPASTVQEAHLVVLHVLAREVENGAALRRMQQIATKNRTI